jgi:hypothetical protein
MAAVEMRLDLSSLINALVAGDKTQILALAQNYLQHGDDPSVLLGRVGMLAVHGDPDGHPSITLAAAAMLCRLLHTIPEPVDPQAQSLTKARALPLFVEPLLAASLSVRTGATLPAGYPTPLYPSGLKEGQTVNEVMHDAVYKNDALLAERLLLGLYGTGADYRTMQARAYEGIATTFQNAGHPLMFAVRGFQLLDAVEWGDQAPNVIHWLAPHLPLRPDSDQPDWVEAVRTYAIDPAHDVKGIRTRLSPPKDERALPLHALILSDADTTRVCQGVYDALIKGEASPRALGSVISLAAADVLNRVGDGDRDLFVHVAHGLLFAASVRTVFRQVQDVEVLPLLFTSAAFINALQKEIATQQEAKDRESAVASASSSIIGGGLIAASQLETLDAQLQARDLLGAMATARRYLKLGHDPRALFAVIALAAGQVDAIDDRGHTLQIVQAAAEEYLNWPVSLANTDHEILLQVAIRAAAFGKRDPLVEHL